MSAYKKEEKAPVLKAQQKDNLSCIFVKNNEWIPQ